MMTPSQIRIVLGRAIGFVPPNGWQDTPSAYPDVMACLTAVAKAETILLTTNELWNKYELELAGIITVPKHTLSANAAQRSEGLLKTIGKYV